MLYRCLVLVGMIAPVRRQRQWVDGHSRFCVSARWMSRERTQAVCAEMVAVMRVRRMPKQILTDILYAWAACRSLLSTRVRVGVVRHQPVIAR